MAAPSHTPGPPISYSLEAAAAATGMDAADLLIEVEASNLTARFWGSKVLITHADLEKWLSALPTHRPTGLSGAAGSWPSGGPVVDIIPRRGGPNELAEADRSRRRM